MALLLSCRNLTKAFGPRPLFRDITLGIAEGERLGLIGPNGSGKSTLLKVLAGLEPPDSGEVSRRRDTRIVYVPQQEAFPAGRTVRDLLADALTDAWMSDSDREARLNAMLRRVGFADPDQTPESLSGGWKKRLAIARALIQEPELLLLDEPTNHLDLDGVLWLESTLQQSPFAYALISHDRMFLENVARQMVEINRAYPDGYLRVEGNYSAFLEAKSAFLQAQANYQDALETRAKREVAWLRRGAQARTTKAQYRIDEAGKLLDELAEVKHRNTQGRSVDIDFNATNRRTTELLTARGVQKTLGGRTLFSDLNLVLSPGRRVGLIGPNGSGKTTLIRLLTGDLEPDTGEIRRASGLRVAFFDQNRAQLDTSLLLRDALSPESDNVTYQGRTYHVSGWAQRFLFRSEQLNQPVSSLSGGEQARILIANMMLQPADLLILDEPTNDLDSPSLEVLEESLLEFPGALLLVTHDRFLLDNVSTEMLALDGLGHTYSYADYAQWERERRPSSPPETSKAATPKPVAAPPRPATRRLSTAEQRELANMEQTIMQAETEVETLQARMADPEVVADHARMDAAWKALQAAQERVATLYTRWEELEARR